jgi:hypothetical protein
MAAPENDRGRLVSLNADTCPLCAQTMSIFTAAYGAEAGVAGLKWLPGGGTYCSCAASSMLHKNPTFLFEEIVDGVYLCFVYLFGFIPFVPRITLKRARLILLYHPCCYLGLYLTGGLTPKCIDYITGKKEGTENMFLGALLDKVSGFVVLPLVDGVKW